MNLFAKACGATGPLQLSVERSDDPATERHIFDAPFLTVGRDSRADLCLTHRGISRRHAYLQLVSGRLFCLDLGSRFGTYLGGECRQAGWVGRRQAIRIGPYRLRLDAGDCVPWASSGADANGGASQSPAASSLPRLFLELWDRSDEPSVWHVERELTLIGTSADCEVRILDPSVSAYHCSLLRTSTGIWVVDLLGNDGVMVNGTSVRYARVYDGDELHLGNALIRLRYELPRQWAVPPAQLAGSGMMALHSPTLGVSRTALPVRWEGPGGGPGRQSRAGVGPPARFPDRAAESIVLSPGALSAEWIPSDEQDAQHVEFFNSLLFPVVDRFGLMQQQVLDQFQQSMMMLFQSFSSMHEEQTDVLRQEFDQLRDLTQELVALRGELAAQTTSARAESVDPLSAESHSGAPANVSPLVNPPASVEVEKSRVGTDTSLASHLGRSPGGDSETIMPSGPDSESLSRPRADRATAAGDRVAASSPPPEAGTKSGVDPGPAIHAQLRQRIMAIQNEQRSSWQRILSLMPGRSQKKFVP